MQTSRKTDETDMFFDSGRHYHCILCLFLPEEEEEEREQDKGFRRVSHSTETSREELLSCKLHRPLLVSVFLKGSNLRSLTFSFLSVFFYSLQQESRWILRFSHTIQSELRKRLSLSFILFKCIFFSNPQEFHDETLEMLVLFNMSSSCHP